MNMRPLALAEKISGEKTAAMPDNGGLTMKEVLKGVQIVLFTVMFLFCFVAMTTVLDAYGAAGKPAAIKQKLFATPEDAVDDLVRALKSDDEKELRAILGPSGTALLSSGDPVYDREGRERFLRKYGEKNRLVREGDRATLLIGDNEWPLTIPLREKDGKWFFDTKAGKDEILNRRIGKNELNTIKAILAMVDAQREYAMKDHDGDGLLEYAQKFDSTPGKQDGLYWETREGDEPSPLGPLAAQARKIGYSGNPSPYNGYYFRTLTSQGSNAAGGAFDYIVKNSMIGGFAIAAYPARYGNSGVMTFMVNHDGVVYEKDLGRDTEKKVKAMKKFDPDKTWKRSEKAL